MKVVKDGIFFTVQGEGPFIGYPMIFVRFSGCNLKCEWCDTKYSWEDGEEMSVADVVEEIREFPCKRVCFTGGEPLLQQQDIVKIIENFGIDYDFHFETNGTIEPVNYLSNLGFHIISPKLQFSYNVAPYYRNESLGYFKFVITGEDDLLDVLKFIEYNNLQNRGNKFYLMPESITVEKQQDILPKLICFAKSHTELNFIVTPRLHILAYGNKRGV